MDRTYLFVAPEENAEVRSQGARWDDFSKRWYIGPDQALERFSRWLSTSEEDDDGFTITSSDACVAAATISCGRCHADTAVICVYCETGIVSGETLTQFTVSGIWAMDGELARQLERWPMFRKTAGSQDEESVFANHCSHCGALQDDMHLHSEPGSPFFDIPHAAAGLVRLTPLVGTVRLSGDEHFVVE
jgi:Domain of unknown function (DUF5710)